MTTPTTGTVTKSVAAELRAEMARQKKSARAIAPDLKVTHTWVARRLRGETPMTIEDVVRIARVLKIDPMPLIELALTP